jgi:molybdenum cofactor cytidylyltransferase
MRTFGLIPAAGKSRRMGRPKLLLPFGASTVLQHVVSALGTAEVSAIVVVTAPGDDDLAALASSAGAHVCRLDEDTPDMRATCLCGLAWIEREFQPHAEDGWLLLPADHPTVRPDVVRALIDTARHEHAKDIFVPVHRGRRGHPTWLRWSHLAGLRAAPIDQGLNRFIRAHADTTCELAWSGDEILCDLDTPADYRRLLDENGAAT